MSSRVILILVWAAGMCVEQSSATPQSTASSGGTAAAKEAPIIGAVTPDGHVQNGSEQAGKQSSVGGDQPGATTPPVLDVPPARKTDIQGTNDKAADKAPAGRRSEKDASPYVIGPLDILIVKVWGQPNLSGPVDVASDGNISLPLINDVKADGLTKEQLKAELTKRLSDFLNNPEVDVQVAKINSKSYFVYGGVGRAGEYPLIKPTTIMDAMSAVGGFREFANTKKIYIMRTLPSGEVKKFTFNYKEVSKGKNMEQNIFLQNGDRIFVPE